MRRFVMSGVGVACVVLWALCFDDRERGASDVFGTSRPPSTAEATAAVAATAPVGVDLRASRVAWSEVERPARWVRCVDERDAVVTTATVVDASTGRAASAYVADADGRLPLDDDGPATIAAVGFHAAVVDAGAGGPWSDPPKVVLRRRIAAQVRVVDDVGAPVANAAVRFAPLVSPLRSAEASGAVELGAVSATADQGGVASSAELAAAAYRLQVEAPGYVWSRPESSPGGGAVVEIEEGREIVATLDRLFVGVVRAETRCPYGRPHDLERGTWFSVPAETSRAAHRAADGAAVKAAEAALRRRLGEGEWRVFVRRGVQRDGRLVPPPALRVAWATLYGGPPHRRDVVFRPWSEFRAEDAVIAECAGDCPGHGRVVVRGAGELLVGDPGRLPLLIGPLTRRDDEAEFDVPAGRYVVRRIVPGENRVAPRTVGSPFMVARGETVFVDVGEEATAAGDFGVMEAARAKRSDGGAANAEWTVVVHRDGRGYLTRKLPPDAVAVKFVLEPGRYRLMVRDAGGAEVGDEEVEVAGGGATVRREFAAPR